MSFFDSPEVANNWAQSKPAETFATLPDGNYIAVINSIKHEDYVSRNGDVYDYLVYSMTVVDGQHSGRKFYKRDLIIPDKSFPYIKRDMLTLKVPIPQHPRDIITSLQAAIGKGIEAKIVTKKGEKNDFTNVYIERLAQVMAPQAKPAQARQTAQAPAANSPEDLGYDKDFYDADIPF